MLLTVIKGSFHVGHFLSRPLTLLLQQQEKNAYIHSIAKNDSYLCKSHSMHF